jgi:hypothetical protein
LELVTQADLAGREVIPWRGGEQLMTSFVGVPSLIQSRYGRRGNFELVVGRAEGGLSHYWRDNDAAGFPWHGPTTFADDLGLVDAACLIQSNLGDPGQLEIVAKVGDQLAHLWRNAQPPFHWHGPELFASGVNDPPGFIQSRYGRTGNFEVVTTTLGEGPSLGHYWRDNDDPSLPWYTAAPFGEFFALFGGGMSLIQSNYGNPGRLEVLTELWGPEGNRSLLHLWRDAVAPFQWHEETIFGQRVAGNPALIQSLFGARGNFEVVVPSADGGISHYWRDNDDPAQPWHGPTNFGRDLGQVEAVSMIQSNFGQAGNLEVAARAADRLLLFWRDSDPQRTWHQGPALSE